MSNMRSSGFTSIGMPAAIHRYAALHSYDNLRRDRPPRELGDANPGGMQAYFPGTVTLADIGFGARGDGVGPMRACVFRLPSLPPRVRA